MSKRHDAPKSATRTEWCVAGHEVWGTVSQHPTTLVGEDGLCFQHRTERTRGYKAAMDKLRKAEKAERGPRVSYSKDHRAERLARFKARQRKTVAPKEMPPIANPRPTVIRSLSNLPALLGR